MFPKLRTRLLGIAFLLGPLLTLIAGVVYVLGIDRNPGVMSWGSSLEGLIGFFGFILLVPVFMALANHLGYSMPKLGALTLITALIGFAGGGVMNMTLRVLVPDLMDAGVTLAMFDALAENAMNNNALSNILIMTGPLGPLTSLLIGIGFLISKQLRSTGWLLLVAGLLFVLGQGMQIAADINYPLALLLWAVALVPIGLRLLRGGEIGVVEMEAAPSYS